MFRRKQNVEPYADDVVREIAAGGGADEDEAVAAYLTPEESFATLTANYDLISAQGAAKLEAEAQRLDRTWRLRKAYKPEDLREMTVLFPAQRLSEFLREVGGLGTGEPAGEAIASATQAAVAAGDRQLAAHQRSQDKETVHAFFYSDGPAGSPYLDTLVADGIAAYLHVLELTVTGAIPAQRQD